MSANEKRICHLFFDITENHLIYKIKKKIFASVYKQNIIYKNIVPEYSIYSISQPAR